MKKIGVLSDTHGHLPKEVYEFFKDVDLIIHAGDIGSVDVLNELQAFKKQLLYMEILTILMLLF